MASTENLRWLKASGQRYLIGTTRAALRQFIPELTSAAGWQSVGEAVEAKLVAGASAICGFAVREADCGPRHGPARSPLRLPRY